ncbi:MAG: hypothetical protein ACTSYR_03865 [Candidatus Odinarchaeia archaeon]
MEDVNKVFWIKVFLGVIIGLISGILGLVGWLGVGIGLGMMFATYPITVYVFKIDPENVGGKRKLLTNGLLQYFLIWLSIWILTYTILLLI